MGLLGSVSNILSSGNPFAQGGGGGGGANIYTGDLSDPMAVLASGDKAGKKALKKQYGNTGYKYLQQMFAYGAGMPQQYDWQLEYQPKYTQAALKNTYQTLMGDGTTPGYLAQYTDAILPRMTAAQNQANSATRAAHAQDFANLGPELVQGIRGANPEMARLYDLLAQQGSEGLQAGSQLTGDQMRNVNNSVRASQGARGMSYGPAASYAEVLANSQYGDNLYQQRQQQAGNVAQLGNQMYSLPMLQAFGMAPGAAGQQSQNFLGGASAYGSAAGPTMFSTQDSTGLYNTIFNQQSAQSIADKNNQGALTGALIGAGGSILGGAAGAI